MLVNPYYSAGYDYAGTGALPDAYHRETTLPVNPYYASGYSYPNLGALPDAYHRETTLPVNPYYASGYSYPNLGAVDTIFGGSIPRGLSGSKLSSAIQYNKSAPGKTGYKLRGTIKSGADLAYAVYVIQANLFSSMSDVDGKLGPKTKAKILASGVAQTSQNAPNLASVKAVAEGNAPLTQINASMLIGALGLVSAPKTSGGGGGGGGGGDITVPPPIGGGGDGASKLPLLLGGLLFLGGGYLLWEKYYKNKK